MPRGSVWDADLIGRRGLPAPKQPILTLDSRLLESPFSRSKIKSQCLEPVNAVFLGKRFFADVSKSKIL